jgi:hypothetical protein
LIAANIADILQVVGILGKGSGIEPPAVDAKSGQFIVAMPAEALPRSLMALKARAPAHPNVEPLGDPR